MFTDFHARTLISGATLVLVLLPGCGDANANGAAPGVTTAQPRGSTVNSGAEHSVAALQDSELAAPRRALLELAFEAASALPLNPHVKTRSNAQADVVQACFELGQLKRAAACIEGIANWRRGEAYADLAFLLAQQGQVELVDPFLVLAEEHSKSESEDTGAQTSQNWRRDRVRARIAATHLLLGEVQAAASFERDLADSERGRTASIKAQRIDQGEVDEHLRALDAILATGSFDPIRNALEAVSLLHGRFYADAATRARLEEKIESNWSRLPPAVRVELLLGLADNALAHQDRAHAGVLLEEARGMIAGFEWTAEQELPLRARTAVFAHRLGESERARGELDQLVERYDGVRAQLASLDRTELLLPLAEARVALGDEAAALSLYARAVEEGAVNPNGRPRAEDLVQTCLSIASQGVTPGPELMAELESARRKLSAPW